MKIRPAHALAVALLALVVALAGTSYAAVQITSKQIKNNTIKSKDIKDGQVTGKDVADGALSGTDLGDGSVTGADLGDGSVTGTDVKDGSLTRADLDRTCSAAAVSALGSCIDKVATGPTSFNAALADCDARGARLMSWPEYKVLVGTPGIVWANGDISQYEFLDVQLVSGGTFRPEGVSFGGSAFGDASAQNFWHRCVTQP